METELFKKGIKQDASTYPVLNNERYFDSWIRGMRAEMKSQGVANICDENYIEPTDTEELAVDRLRQGFMYALFN